MTVAHEAEARPMDRSLAPVRPDGFGKAEARHLLRRAAFGATESQVDALVALGPEGAADAILAQLDFDDQWPDPEGLDPDIIAPATELERQAYSRARREQDEEALREFSLKRNAARRADQQMTEGLRKWWLERLSRSDTPVRENLVLLWHGHFATRHRDIRDGYLMYRQNEMFRDNPTRFDALARAIVRDPAMLRFLNNDRNTRRKPNENLAREIMELFTLGEGNYTEHDIRQSAKALTGYHVIDNDFHFRPTSHDPGPKKILGTVGKYDGDALVELLLAQEACPQFVAMKLYSHFVLDVADHPEQAPPASRLVIKAMGEMIERDGYDLRPVLRRLFASRHFHDPAVVGRKVKSPAHLIAGSVRTLGTPMRDEDQLKRLMQLMGQVLFDPPSVAGWDGGPAWINTSTLFIRQNTAAYLITGVLPDRGSKKRRDDYDPMPLLEPVESRSPQAVVDHLVNLLLGEHVPSDRRAPLVAFLDGRDVDRDTMTDLLLLITAMPEYQLC